MKYFLLVTSGLIVLFFGVYFGFRFWGQADEPAQGGTTNTDTDAVKGWELYTSPDGSVSVEHPAEARVAPIGSGPTQEWRVGATKASGILLADIRILGSYMPGTNFSDARFTIGRSADAEEIKSCTAVQDSMSERKDVKFGGYPFVMISTSEAAAGNRYDSTMYRGIFDGDCYAIEYTIHSTNIGNYPPERGIREFDKDKIVSIMEKMADSVEFLISSD